MECEMCGSAAALKKACVEGTMIRVCERCLKFGKIIEDSPQLLQRKPTIELKESVIDPDFSKKIRRARENEGLSLEELSKKISVSIHVLERIEKGMRPTDDVAKCLEKALRIKLLGFAVSTQQKTSGKAPPLTLGDIAEVRIKKK